MIDRRHGRLIALAAIGCAVSTSPAAAAVGPENAADHYGVAPGGDSFAVIAGRPHVAFARASGVRVARLAGFDRTWRNVGGLVRHARGSRFSKPFLTGGPDGHPWLTWVEADRSRSWDPQVRVATFARGRWHEIGRGFRPINGVTDPGYSPPQDIPGGFSAPSMVFYRGLPVVAFGNYDASGGLGPRTAQLDPGGRSWHRFPVPDLFDAKGLRIVSAGGRLYAGGTCCYSTGGSIPELARLNTAGTRWAGLSNIDPNAPEDPGPNGNVDALGNVNGQFTVLWRHFRPDPDLLNVSVLGSGDKWSEVDPPLATPGSPSTGLAVAGDHAVAYAAYRSANSSTPGVFVRRLIRGGWEELRTPTEGGYRGVSAQFAPARGRGMWLLSGERANGRMRYLLDGYSVVSPPQLPPGAQPAPPAPRPRTVHWWDNGGSVHLVRGQSLVVITDRSNSGSTGTFWNRARRRNGSVLRFASTHAVRGGQRIVYRAARNGSTSLVLKYTGPGRRAEVFETFRLNVRVG